MYTIEYAGIIYNNCYYTAKRILICIRNKIVWFCVGQQNSFFVTHKIYYSTDIYFVYVSGNALETQPCAVTKRIYYFLFIFIRFTWKASVLPRRVAATESVPTPYCSITTPGKRSQWIIQFVGMTRRDLECTLFDDGKA